MMWRAWLKAAFQRMELLAIITLSLAVVSVLTVLELEKQREASYFQSIAQRYALLLDEKLAQAEATMHAQSTHNALAANAQALITQQPWLIRLEQRNASGDLLWSHVFTEAGAKQPEALSPALVLSLQEGATRLGRPHYSALQPHAFQNTILEKSAQIHVAWPLGTADRYGLATWSIPKLLSAVNTDSRASLGVEAIWVADDTLASNPQAQEQWVRLGSTGVMLALQFTATSTPTSNWQSFAVPLMTVLLLLALGLLYRETFLRQRAEAQTREQQERVQANARLATLGEIATMISHEINQPLAAIETYAATCEKLIAQNKMAEGTLQQALGGVRAQAERAGRIIRSVQDFAQSRKEATQGVDVMEVVRELSTLIDIQAKRFEAIVKVQGVPGIRIHTDKTMIEQVLLNLVRNGLEAMRQTPQEKRLLEVTIGRTSTWLEISVTDNGCGVSPDIKGRLFQPFVTNKPQGTGVGLSLCKSLVEKYRGRIAHADKPTGGSVFTVRLPIAHDAPVEA